MRTSSVRSGVASTSVRRPFGDHSTARVVDLSEYRRRQAADPVSGVRRRLRRELEAKGVSVESLAAMTGLHPVAIADFFRGAQASPREITRIASVLGLSWSLLSGRA